MKPTEWKRTGDCRVAPWWFGIMRAEFMERRDFIDPNGVFGTTFQTRWVGAGRFPAELDVTSPFGFWSTMSTPVGDTQHYGDRALWRGFITYFRSNDKKAVAK